MNQTDLLSRITEAEPYNVFHRFVAPVQIAFLPAAEHLVIFERSDLEPAQVAAALRHLESLPATLRTHIAQSLFETCLRSFSDCDCDFPSPQSQLDYEKSSGGDFPDATVPNGPQDIWALVSLRDIRVVSASRKARTNAVTAVIYFSTAWDGEHGVALLFPTDRHDFVTGSLND